MKYHLKIAHLSSYPPRECGIATYTADLVNAFRKFNSADPVIIALKDQSENFKYPPEVQFQIADENPKDYIKAADWVNKSDIQLVSLQHEFGLLGPKKIGTGEYILEFVCRLKKPFVTTYHTVLPGPSAERLKVINQLADLSQKTIVLIGLGKKYLTEIYDIAPSKINVIHHGVPDIGALRSTKKAKKLLGFENKLIITTHGLVNPGKGIQYMLRAIPKLIKKYPNILYLIIGQTHPHIKQQYGEVYRQKLLTEVEKLGIQKHVRFINKFLSLDEIVDFFKATDLYITPYLNPQQITSGALAKALGAGKVCISTRYLYAKEALGRGRGVFIDYKNPNDIVKKIDNLLRQPNRMKKMAKKTYAYGRQMIWPAVAQKHLKLFDQIIRKEPLMRKIWRAQRRLILPVLRRAPRILNTSKR